ncbi:hypothetical protein A2160_03515 [Candidatus Beckwithbacteria bacterium RBG_13_42_9]|uniref:DUF192 domain-containing protein n=1 Tax=Candidatus Beckwithbacteria bacterium RBG_13_42_9 TaxID=1797457 RepID=A0A1F5E8P1_9BACT|nr:MAG: hypothetical protein A2160_03515 [Candidatus Beckwithbacteria bacterium RBG_13_42_9]
MKALPKKIFIFCLFAGICLILLALSTKSVAGPFVSSQNPRKSVAANPNLPQITINNTTLNLELAKTEAQKEKGLGEHKPLTENEGMLFVYSPPEQVSFWMKDMTFPIDIIYISDGKVMQISPSVLPPPAHTPLKNLKTYHSQKPVDYVLETSAGWCEKNQVQIGNVAILENI